MRRRRIAEKARRLAKESHLKTPVTIVTGFLGSGKTTLINRILTSEDLGKRIVVIENEIGAISIDDRLLRAGPQERAAVGIFVMKNGCICCKGSGGGDEMELERVLNHVLELQDEDQYDHVLIETSGLADPSPVMQTFFRWRLFSPNWFEKPATLSRDDALRASAKTDALFGRGRGRACFAATTRPRGASSWTGS